MRTVTRVCDAIGCSLPTAQRLVQEAVQEEATLIDTIDRQEFLAQQMSRLEALAVRAQEEGNLSVALSAFKELHALVGLHPGRGGF